VPVDYASNAGQFSEAIFELFTILKCRSIMLQKPVNSAKRSSSLLQKPVNSAERSSSFSPLSSAGRLRFKRRSIQRSDLRAFHHSQVPVDYTSKAGQFSEAIFESASKAGQFSEAIFESASKAGQFSEAIFELFTTLKCRSS
jgi:hypothetical protein